MVGGILVVFAESLIYGMLAFLAFALIFRWLAWRLNLKNESYFLSFAREIEKQVSLSENFPERSSNPAQYIENMLQTVEKALPKRRVRGGKVRDRTSFSESGKQIVSLREYVGGKNGLLHGIRDEINIFLGSYRSDFREMARRLMSKDENWVKLFGVIPIDRMSKLLDALPGIFVVLGIFGTFIGISQALPELAKIDVQNLDSSGETLSQFVLKVTFAMDTSIVGILCSLILTFLNILFPIRETRTMIFTKVAESLERLWRSLHGKEEDSFQSAFPKILNALEKIDSSIKSQDSKLTKVG